MENSEQNGDLLIRDLWKRGTESIHDMHVVNTGALSHRKKLPEKYLQMSERDKNNNYMDYCLHQRRNLPPFVVVFVWPPWRGGRGYD